MLTPDDYRSIDDFLRSAPKVLLTGAQEIQFGRQIRKWQDHEGGPDAAPELIRRRGIRARNRLVEANLRLVVKFEKLARRTPLEMADRLQAGTEGLIRAAERFDPERGYKFSTYCAFWIRQRIGRAAVRWSSLSIPSSQMERGDPEAVAAAVGVLHLDQPCSDGAGSALLVEVIPGREVLDVENLIHSEALAAMEEFDPDALAALSLQVEDNANLGDLIALGFGSSIHATGKRLKLARERFRAMPEVIAALH